MIPESADPDNSKPTVNPELLEMLERENRPFTGQDDWKERAPRCPECKKQMGKKRGKVNVKQFDRNGYDVCLDEDCTDADHVTEFKAQRLRCGRNNCANKAIYISDPLRSEVTLKCKCDLGDDVSWGQMTIHLQQRHGIGKHALVQMMFDKKRPQALEVGKGVDEIEI